MATIQKQLGEYLKGEFVKEKGITFLTISTEPRDVDGVYGVKLVCDVTYDGYIQGNPHIWTLNQTSRNALIDKYGNDTAKMVGKKIPIETSITEKGRAIFVDRTILEKL